MTNPAPTPAEQSIYVYTERDREHSDRQEVHAEGQVILDFSRDGRLLGVEVLDAYEVTLDGQAALASQPAADTLDVKRVKQAVVNIAKRHGLAKDPPIPVSVARIYGYSTAPETMDAEIAAEYAELGRLAAYRDAKGTPS